MLVSRNWLKKYVNLADSVAASDIASKLTLSTVEVENYVEKAVQFDHIVVGKVEKVEPHPNADKLKVCIVNIGNDRVHIVCGGSNVYEGMLTVVALPGAQVRWHGEGELVTLEPTTIRGVASHGMICASDEVGLADIFPKKEEKEVVDMSSVKYKPGYPVAQALGLDDVVFEIDNKSLSNRPDLWGHYGIARELAALYKRSVVPYKVAAIKPKKEYVLKVDISAKKECLRYQGLVMAGVYSGPSPLWLKNALNTVGIQSVNCIVDATNYVMLDYGEPLHAFDAHAIFGSEKQGFIHVRHAKKGEHLTLLDDKKVELTEEMLVIANAEKPLALAGIMGGKNSVIAKDTSTIVLEAACFESSSIRRASTKLGLRTDASARFEKGLDPNVTHTALAKVVELIMEICPGSYVASPVVDVYGSLLKQKIITMPLSLFAQKLGTNMSSKIIVPILERLGFGVKQKKDMLAVMVPTWRSGKDIALPEDIVEEVVRMYGYDQIPSSLPIIAVSTPAILPVDMWTRCLQDIAVHEFGSFDVYNYSFVSSFQIRRLGDDIASYLELDNPLSKEKPFLRRNIVINLLDNIEKGLVDTNKISLCEVGKVFLKEEPGLKVRAQSDDLLPRQDTWFGMVYAEVKNNEPFWQLRKFLERCASLYGYEWSLEDNTSVASWQHPYRSFEVCIAGAIVGSIYEMHPVCSAKWGIEPRVAVLELNVSKLAELSIDHSHMFVPTPHYPEVVRDVAFWVSVDIVHEALVHTIHGASSLIKKVELFDVYRDKQNTQRKSMAYRVTLGKDDSTLTSAEIEDVLKNIQDKLLTQFKADMRS